MATSYVAWTVATAATGVLLYANLPVRYTIGALHPKLSDLADARLELLKPGDASKLDRKTQYMTVKR